MSAAPSASLSPSNSPSPIHVIDSVLCDPHDYRAQVLKCNFRTYELGGYIFHGIAVAEVLSGVLPGMLSKRLPELESKFTFFRKSAYGQVEPNFVHTDMGMGDWTGILYLNEYPACGDGTDFWKHIESGHIEAFPGLDRGSDWTDLGKWRRWKHVEARFNRLLIFPAPYFHSRSIYSNYGVGDGARLIQVVFGSYAHPPSVG